VPFLGCPAICVEHGQSFANIAEKGKRMSVKSIIARPRRTQRVFARQAIGLILACLGTCSSLLATEAYKEIGQPGEPINLRPYIVGGRYTVFDFGSEYCPPCRATAAQFKVLAQKYPKHYAFRRIDINRPGIVGIDWTSPLARQYGLQSIPHLVVYGPDERLIAEGDAAEKWMADDLKHLQRE
jgi:thiol-disulfide isomerase/thioredoxin